MVYLRTTLVVVLALFAAVGLTPRPAVAQTAALKYVQTLGDRAILELTDKSATDRERVMRMRALLLESFDVPAVSQFVLGTYWRQTTEDQRKEFIKLYSTVVSHTYAGLFKKYSGEQFKVQRERAVDDEITVVYAQIIQPSGAEPIAIEITTKTEPSGEYKAVDIKVEGISMPLTHRKEYASVIQRNSGKVSELLKLLKQKADSLEAQTPSQ